MGYSIDFCISWGHEDNISRQKHIGEWIIGVWGNGFEHLKYLE